MLPWVIAQGPMLQIKLTCVWTASTMEHACEGSPGGLPAAPAVATSARLDAATMSSTSNKRFIGIVPFLLLVMVAPPVSCPGAFHHASEGPIRSRSVHFESKSGHFWNPSLSFCQNPCTPVTERISAQKRPFGSPGGEPRPLGGSARAPFVVRLRNVASGRRSTHRQIARAGSLRIAPILVRTTAQNLCS